MRSDVDETENLISVQQKALAHLKSPREWVHAALTKSRSKIDPQLKKVVVPNIEKLSAQYGLSEELYDRYRTLEAVETQIAAQFPDRRGDAYERAVGALRELKKKIASQLRSVLLFLSSIAAKHVPKTFNNYRQAIAQEIEDHVIFDASEQFLYVNTNSAGDLVFTNYVMILNAKSDDGRTVPHLYISTQWIVGVATYIQVNHEFELPAALDRDHPAATMQEAVTTLSMILTAEGFAI
jgi:hypothetical protein